MKKRNLIIIILLGVITVMEPNFVLAGDEEVRVAIFEFDTGSDREYDHIRFGLPALFSSRIHAPNKIMVIEKQHINKLAGKKADAYSIAQKILISKKVNADFLLTGYLKTINDSLQVEIILLVLPDKASNMIIYKEIIGFENMIMAIGKISKEIKETIITGPPYSRNIAVPEVAIPADYDPGDRSEIKQKPLSAVIFSIHAGSFRKKETAEDEVARLKRMGFEAVVKQTNLGKKGVWYRVKIGKFSTLAEAEKVLQKLQQKVKVKSRIIRE